MGPTYSSLVEPSNDRDEELSKDTLRRPKGEKLKVTLLLGVASIVLSLVVNLVILVWSLAVFKVKDGSVAVFEGSCKKAGNIVSWSELLINALSTALLAVSNNATQLLISPTRQDVTQSHSRGGWLNVGAPQSWRNFRFMGTKRKVLFVSLALSSIPLHYIYNSVIYLTSASNGYVAAVVTPDFLTGGFWNSSAKTSDFEGFESTFQFPNWSDPIKRLQENQGSLTRLDNLACITAYSDPLTSEWGNVILVTNVTSGFRGPYDVRNDTLILPLEHSPSSSEGDGRDLSWLCGDFRGVEGVCTPEKAKKGAEKWAMNDPFSGQGRPPSGGTWGYGYGFYAPIKYCLAEPRQAPCSARISPPLLGVVVACNLIKLVCIYFVLGYLKKSRPLATVGDAVASFLRAPEDDTLGLGPVSKHDVTSRVGKEYTSLQQEDSQGIERGNGQRTTTKLAIRPWKHDTSTWGHGAGPIRGKLGFFIFCSLLIVGIVFLSLAIDSARSVSSNYSNFSRGNWLQEGLSPQMNRSYIKLSQSLSLGSNILLVNLPQLILATITLLYNNMLTAMFGAAELAGYQDVHKSLRVTFPQGGQRGTYWLQIPLRYGIPVLVLNAVLHWAIGRSIFLVRFDVTDPMGNVAPEASLTAVGFSPVGILIAECLGGLLLLILAFLAMKRIPGAMPFLGGCSLAISAACHPPAEDEGAELRAVRYGVVSSNEEKEEVQKEGEGDKKHVSFTSMKVSPLEANEVYV